MCRNIYKLPRVTELAYVSGLDPEFWRFDSSRADHLEVGWTLARRTVLKTAAAKAVVGSIPALTSIILG
jgi:hypothetical protein